MKLIKTKRDKRKKKKRNRKKKIITTRKCLSEIKLVTDGQTYGRKGPFIEVPGSIEKALLSHLYQVPR